ncbi:MAG TPA: hypothetical protein VKT70_13225 [Stellaceae bacterium]|nr:hypothetical protein [Stellaceae bacterium]
MFLLVMAAGAARAAELKINPTTEEQGEVSFEDNSAVVLDRGHSIDAKQTHFGELGYGVTDYWWTELEGQWQGENGLTFRTLDFENAFRFLEQGTLVPEAALFVEYDQAVERASPDTATLGLLLKKDFGPSETTLNLLFDHDLGSRASTGIRARYAGISVWTFTPELAPGIEFFGQPGRLPRFDRLDTQDHRLGPVLHGGVEVDGLGEFSYNLGYVFGLTPASPIGTLVWRFEFGTRF